MVWPNRPHTEEQIIASAKRRLIKNAEYVDPPPGIVGQCRLWTCRCDKDGYGQMKHRGTTKRAMRVAYEVFVGPIPDELVLDHLCRRRRCTTEDHLEPVTTRINLLRGETSTARKAAQTHCVNGHAFTPSNTYVYPNARLTGGVRRTCRQCAIDRTYKYRALHQRTRNS